MQVTNNLLCGRTASVLAFLATLLVATPGPSPIAEGVRPDQAAPRATAVDPLWSKAVAIADRNRHWVARNFLEEQTVYDSDGEIRERTISAFAVSGRSRSALELRVESSLKNGADQLAAKRAEVEKRQRNRGQRGVGNDRESPFAPENQTRVSHRRLGPERDTVIAGRNYRAFAFRQVTAEGTWDGVAYLDARTGAPGRLRSTARIDTLPEDPENKYRLRSMRVTVNYDTSDLRAWRASSMRLDLGITIAIAPLLNFDGRVRNVYSFRNFERLAD